MKKLRVTFSYPYKSCLGVIDNHEIFRVDIDSVANDVLFAEKLRAISKNF